MTSASRRARKKANRELGGGKPRKPQPARNDQPKMSMSEEIRAGVPIRLPGRRRGPG
jgi:hypothetical protein